MGVLKPDLPPCRNERSFGRLQQPRGADRLIEVAGPPKGDQEHVVEPERPALCDLIDEQGNQAQGGKSQENERRPEPTCRGEADGRRSLNVLVVRRRRLVAVDPAGLQRHMNAAADAAAISPVAVQPNTCRPRPLRNSPI